MARQVTDPTLTLVQSMARATEELGLIVEDREPWRARRTIGGLPLGLLLRVIGGRAMARVEVSGLPSGIWLKPRRSGALTIDRHELRTGHPSFDAAFTLAGPPWGAMAPLDAHARTVLLRQRSLDFRLSSGCLQVELAEADARGLVDIARSLLELAGAIRAGGTIEEQLLESAKRDPIPAVRERCLKALLEWAETGREARLEGAALALASSAPGLRLLGGRYAPEGWRALAVLAADPAVDVALRQSAVLTLPEGAPAAALRRVAEATLLDVDMELRLACARRLPRWRCTVSGAAEVGLLGLLERVEEAYLITVVEALGAAGSPRSVPALSPLADAWFGDRALKRAATASIAEIQGRAVHTGEGALSLSSPEEVGAISLSHDAGALSLTVGDD